MLSERLSTIKPGLQWLEAMAKSDQAAFYEGHPADYEKIVKVWFARQAVAEGVAQIVADRFDGRDAPTSYLDVACGTGLVIDELAKTAAPGAKLVGVDLSQPSLDYAAATKSERIKWQVGNFLDLDGVAPDSVDVYTMVGAYRHIAPGDRSRFFAEMARVLSGRGVAIIPQLWPADMSFRQLNQVRCNYAPEAGLNARVVHVNFDHNRSLLAVRRALILEKLS